ncbi:MAG: dihydrofolate reductase family protein [Chloroflexi bacterium]|nr:dihydrofolate reductase family protein [Chloroflexota bacterium]
MCTPTILQQCLKTKLVDELHVDVAPVLLGSGVRLFDRLGARSPPADYQRSQQLLPVGTGHVYRPGAHRRWVFARRLQGHVRRHRACRHPKVPVLRGL